MTNPGRFCAACGRHDPEQTGWFLLVESGWEDRIKVLQWDDILAYQRGVHSACGISHVEQLIAHWLATGSLRHPFTGSESETEAGRKGVTRYSAAIPSIADRIKNLQLGEIAVDRTALTRVLCENPQSLVCMLEMIMSALERRQPSTRLRDAAC